MIVIVCVDNNLGMLFNNRRLSQDKTVTDKVLDLSKQSKLWMNHYSYALFDKVASKNLNVDEDFLSKAARGDFCFIEDKKIKTHEKLIEKIILIKWNRDYPADFKLDIDLSSWNLIDMTEFIGNSHKTITMEVYTR